VNRLYGIAQNAKRLIRKKCFNQAAVAEKAGYNYKTFNNMLNGRKVITDSDVARIANALEVEPNELYGIKSQ
jgi:transcriptional regulator with XRE-family HTH domain